MDLPPPAIDAITHPDYASNLESGKVAEFIKSKMLRIAAHRPETRDVLLALNQCANGWLHAVLGSNDGYIYIQFIRIPDEQQRHGIGTAIMEALCEVADRRNWILTVTPDRVYGASSVGRLTKFYRRFGFVPNKGQRKDFETQAAMYRTPNS